MNAIARSLTAFVRGVEGQGGQAILLVAVTMMGLLMMVGLAIDAGQLYASRRTMQEAADAGAYAGAVVLYQKGTLLQANAAAVNDARLNTFENNVDGFTVTVNAPPQSGAYNGNPRYVEVIISGYVRTAIVPAQSVLNFIRVRGVAGAEPLNNDYAIMALARGNVDRAFYADDEADIHLSGGGILVNSISNTAAVSSQEDPARFNITPNTETVDIAGLSSGTTWPAGITVNTAQPQQPDPFSGMPKPPTTNCSPSDPLDPPTPCAVFLSGTPGAIRTLNPGIYKYAIGSAGTGDVILNPGVYILTQGISLGGSANLWSAGLDVWSSPSAHAATCVTNCGIFIFSTHTNYPGPFRPGIDSCGQTDLRGRTAVTVAAMTTHPNPDFPYLKFLFYQDPACSKEAATSAGNQTWDLKISGNASFNGSGTIYIPTNNFTFDGTNATLTGSQLVASTVNLQSGNITINFTAGAAAQPILPRLAE